MAKGLFVTRDEGKNHCVTREKHLKDIEMHMICKFKGEKNIQEHLRCVNFVN